MEFIDLVGTPSNIAKAIRRASQSTGTDFDFLLKTASRESSFEENAKSKTSSAAGLFQFIEDTWLRTVKDEGPSLGLSKYADQINKTRAGKYYVPNASNRKKLLNLRNDPEIASVMAGAYARQNTSYMKNSLGRTPSQGELYLAHFLGPGEAARMVKLSNARPDVPADRAFPKAAKSNPSIFYSKKGARSVRDVYNELVKAHADTGVRIAKPQNDHGSWKARITEGWPRIAPLYPGAGEPYPLTFQQAEAIGVWETTVIPAPADDSEDRQGDNVRVARAGVENTALPGETADNELRQIFKDGWEVRVSRTSVENGPQYVDNAKPTYGNTNKIVDIRHLFQTKI